MFKKTTAIFLGILMMFAMAVPAMAASESIDEGLARVTKIVKATLGIGDSYTKFDGRLTDSGSYSNWYLTWSDNDGSLSVTADSSGKVLSYHRYKNTIYSKSSSAYSPAFEKTSREDALKVAEAFVKKVFGTGETAYFNDNDTGYNPVKVESYYFNGIVLLNGLKSPISFSVNVLAADMGVNNFSRNDSYSRFTGAIPSAVAKATPETAAALLAGKVKMKLQYVLPEEGKPAVLRYLPVYTGNYIVKADTGELVDLGSTMYGITDAKGMGGSLASAASPKSGLTAVELASISTLEGVYTKEKLDSSLRTVPGLGLDGFKIDSAGYSKDTETGDIYCQLRYIKTITDESAIKERFPDYYTGSSKAVAVRPVNIYKYIMVNAKTVALKSISTSTSYTEKIVLDKSELLGKASTFLMNVFPEKYSKIAINEESSDQVHGNFNYSEIANGIPFPQNSVSISIDTYDGSVSSLSFSWKDGVKFDSADGVVSNDNAKAAYNSCFKPVLQYVAAPASSTKAVVGALPATAPATSSVVAASSEEITLILAYKYESDKYVTGVDAKTGKPIIAENSGKTPALTYDDIQNCYGKTQIEALAKYRIGFSGTSFKPEAQLTQKDALTLLLSAVGYTYDEKNEDGLYEMAYRYNFLTSDEKNPGKLLTRAEFVKMFVSATEYGSAGKLTGIFRCGFNDDGSISGDYYGYVAIAKGLGIVKGDENNNFNPSAALSRQDSAIMLYNFMSR